MKESFSKTNTATPTPAPGVVVESINTVGPAGESGPVGSAGVPGPAAPVIDVPATVTPAAAIPTAPVTAAVAVIPPAAVAAPEAPPVFDEDNITLDDIYLPKINIVQGVGDLSVVFNAGEIVLNATEVIHVPANEAKKVAGNPPLNITILGFRKKVWVEKTTGGAKGLMVNSEADVPQNGGTLSYKEWELSTKTATPLKYFQPYSVAFLLCEKPAHIPDVEHLSFPYEHGGKFYALACWGMKGTAYTNAAKHFFTARKIGALRAGYSVRSFSLTTKCEKYGNNFAQIPVVRPGEANTPEFLAFVKTVLGISN